MRNGLLWPLKYKITQPSNCEGVGRHVVGTEKKYFYENLRHTKISSYTLWNTDAPHSSRRPYDMCFQAWKMTVDC